MSNDLEQDPSWLELIKAFETGLIIVEGEPIVYEYRLYYDKFGCITRTTIFQRDPILDGPYVVADQDIHSEYKKYHVLNGKLVKRKDGVWQTAQIVPSTMGFTVIKNNPALLLEADEVYKDTEFYDYRSD